ncbi:hypothetical protein LCGC14_2210330 [marine sediment metagenome]|uniref:NAD/GMP synthase domain-containing protein n=1 Tax=marine sediment metagenome TaxID=412755 RepID=A0A0F9DE53_9ZZZZ
MNCKKETDKVVRFIQEEFKTRGFEKAVIGISGGLDSSVIATLSIKALGKENIYGYTLPCSTQKDIADSYTLARNLNTDFREININRAVCSFFPHEKYKNEKERIKLGNIKARVRMIYLYNESLKHNALVIGTGNRTELLLGYFTLYGDGACALEPIGHLYKTEVKEIAKYIRVPECIINKIPSAGLWEGQTDEGELGASYEEIDNCLKVWYNECKGEIPNHMVKLVTERIEKNKFKSELPKQLERS